MSHSPTCLFRNIALTFRSVIASTLRRRSSYDSISPDDLQTAILRKQMSLRSARTRMDFENKNRSFRDPDLGAAPDMFARPPVAFGSARETNSKP